MFSPNDNVEIRSQKVINTSENTKSLEKHSVFGIWPKMLRFRLKKFDYHLGKIQNLKKNTAYLEFDRKCWDPVSKSLVVHLGKTQSLHKNTACLEFTENPEIPKDWN